ncbi:MAG: hypothetical protein ACH36H_06490 [Candidatus Nanopelagicales bacterium]
MGIPAIAATAALGAAALPVQAAPNPAPQSIPGGDPYVVALGDSYISGEGAITSNRGYSDPTPSGNWTNWEVGARSTTIGDKSSWGYSGLVYGDKADWADINSEETIRFCHRSYWGATNGLNAGADGLKMANLACSGATTNSQVGSNQHVKPGIDFAPVGNTVGQAQLLQDFAKTKRVKVVALSIGGNDAGFADIASSCIKGFTLGWFGYHCHTKAENTNKVTPEAMLVIKNKIKGAVANIVTAMDAAGYARADWKLVYQQVPMPVAEVPAFKESGYDRQNKGGCAMYNDDLKWIYDTVFTRLSGAMKGAIEESKGALGATPVTYVDNTGAFAGHKLCEGGVVDGAWNMKTVNHISADPAHSNALTSAEYAKGSPAPANAGYNGQKSEWATPVILGDQLGNNDRTQNPLHPNYWGQRALAACNDAALAAGDNKIVTCAQKADKSQDAKGRPAMELTSVNNIVFKTVPGKPTITAVGSADKALKLSFTAPTDPGTPGITKYQYGFQADAPDAEWIDVPVGGGTPDNPEQPALLVQGPEIGPGFNEFINGSLYQIYVRAVNPTGNGPASDVMTGTPAPVPLPPTINSVTPGKYSADLDVTEGDTGGVGLDSYEYRIVAPASVALDWTTVIGDTTSPLFIDDLPGDVKLAMELRERTSGGVSTAVQFEVTPGPIGSVFTALDAPVRLADKTPLNMQTVTLDVSTLPGAPVPVDATALAVNLTMANPNGPGHAELFPANVPDNPEHATSVLNWTSGERLANGVNVSLADGKFKLRAVGQGDFYVDVVGYFRSHLAPTSGPQVQGAPTGTFTPLANPVRAFEQVVQPGDGTVASGVVVDLGKDKGGAAIPGVDMTKVNAVVYNLTAADGTAAGHLRVQPFAATPGPLTPTSALNWFGEGDVVANSSVVRPGEDGKVVVYNGSARAVKVMVDIQGYFVTDGTGLRYFPIDPARTFDSRVGPEAGVVSHPAKAVVVSDEIDENGNIYEYDVVPANAQAIAFNLTEAQGTTRDHFRAFPGTGGVPDSSLINWPAAGHNRANATMLGVDSNAGQLKISLFSPGQGAHAIVDVLGYFSAPAS